MKQNEKKIEHRNIKWCSAIHKMKFIETKNEIHENEKWNSWKRKMKLIKTKKKIN